MAFPGLDSATAARRVPVDPAVARAARAIVGEAWFRDAVPDKLAYGRDCWPLGILWTRGGQVQQHLPDFIVIPASRDEVVALVRLARESGTPIIPYGAGSGVCGGTLALRGGFTLDVKRLDGLPSIDAGRLAIRAGAGLIGMHVETDLNRRGLTLGHYPSSLYCSSLGGYLAARSAGQQSSRYGKIEDMCLSLELVTGTADVLETARCRPDLTQIAIGSEGTLGIITEATLRVEPWPDEREYRGFSFHTEEVALDAVRELLQAGFRPCVVRLYDTFDSLIASRGGADEGAGGEVAAPPSLLGRLSGFARERSPATLRRTLERAAAGLVQRAVGRPLLLNRMAAHLPGSCLLIVGFEGPTGLAAAEAAAAWDVLGRHGHDLGPGPGEHWHAHRFDISYKQSPMMDVGCFVDTMEVSTTWDNLHHLYREVRHAIGQHAFIMAHFSHVYPEGSSIYFTFAGFAPDGEPIQTRYAAIWQAGLEAVRRTRSSITHHHGVGVSKAPHLVADHHGGAALQARVKARLDPDGIMNPGKLWDVPQIEEIEA